MTARRWVRGLRARLLVAFALVTVLGAAAASWAATGSAAAALLAATEEQFTGTVTGRIAGIAPSLTYPPDQETLDRLAAAVGPNTVATWSPAADPAGDQVVAQRVVRDGVPWLLVGTGVAATAPDGTRTASGLKVRTALDLTGVQRQIDELTRAAVLATALAMVPAFLLALLAARGVLRPVRELRDTADRLAAGDLTARSRPRGGDELAELTDTVNRMAESLQASMAAMDRMRADARRFAADVSHELRTPLSTLTAVTEVLEDATADLACVDADAAESARLAIAETQRLVGLVEDLMEVSRFDAGTATLRLEQVDVTDAVRHSLRARGWAGRVELAGPAELRLRLDARRLDVVVANLVGNALRHGAPPVRVRVSSTADDVLIEVVDGGPGLAAEVAPHVFDRFYKADAARSRTPGSGLGLAIALENARLHGGTITAEESGGSGARFVVRLPRR